MIYNTIHQSWSSKTIPAKYLKIKIQNKKFLKDFKFKLWTDDENNFFIKNKYPSFYKIYENYNQVLNDINEIKIGSLMKDDVLYLE